LTAKSTTSTRRARELAAARADVARIEAELAAVLADIAAVERERETGR
jgi:hypothetical protein